MNQRNSDDPKDLMDEDNGRLPWAVEIEGVSTKSGRSKKSSEHKSHFYSAKKIILDDEYALIQMEDGSYTSYPIDKVRKVLCMRTTGPAGYTDEDFSEAELH